MTPHEIHVVQDKMTQELSDHDALTIGLYEPLRSENIELCSLFRQLGISTPADTILFGAIVNRASVNAIAVKLRVWCALVA